eukprot:1147943-Pelagomonas_calceolata.AAC.3
MPPSLGSALEHTIRTTLALSSPRFYTPPHIPHVPSIVLLIERCSLVLAVPWSSLRGVPWTLAYKKVHTLHNMLWKNILAFQCLVNRLFQLSMCVRRWLGMEA